MDLIPSSHLLMLTGAENEVKAHGYQIILNYVQSYEEEIEVLNRLKGESICGVLLWPNAAASSADPQAAAGYQEIRLPIVVMDRQIRGIDCDCVTSENYAGAMELVTHLIKLGHERIVFLTHQENHLLPVKERYEAYIDAMKEANLVPAEPWRIGAPGEEIHATDALRASVDSRVLELQQIKNYLLTTDPRPTAIFAINDYIAVLAMRSMRLLGLSIPDDISLAGFDDVNIAAHLEVPLTTVAQDSFMIGKRAAAHLIGRLEGYSGETTCEYIPTQLRIRSSTAAPIRALS